METGPRSILIVFRAHGGSDGSNGSNGSLGYRRFANKRALHVCRYLYTCLRMLVRTCMHGECWEYDVCGYERGMNPWQLSVFDEGFHLTSRLRSGAPEDPLSSGVTRIPGYCLSNTAPLPSAPHRSLLPRD
ncbi:unnamed protein product [Pleuronectes platessa]|uniref:Uncharacterized protein n=1 Tax=Pleuronectes platessa TaxID=8262 RepID=A0A9N7U970_PLEPL|nr:unnamed protein product [Pleuronectes platessa]